MTEERMRVGGILVSQSLGMISILGTPVGPGMAGQILEALGRSGINVEFISSCPDSAGGDTLVLCVESGRLQAALEAVGTVRDRIRPAGITMTQGLVSVSVFGPHFREIPSVAGRIFGALAEVGVNILAISTSISSVTSVFEERLLETGLASLREHFEVG